MFVCMNMYLRVVAWLSKELRGCVYLCVFVCVFVFVCLFACNSMYLIFFV